MKKNYFNVVFKVMEERFPYFYVIIENYDIKGIEERYDELMVCFDEVYWTEDIRSSILEQCLEYIPEIEVVSEELVPDENWMEEWEKSTPVIIVNERIGIAPGWKADELQCDVKLIINPKMSFGTGQHSTTKLVCALMEKAVRSGEFWIDAGTGTGVLAILAMKLGAARVLAFDNDEWSIDNALENFKLNGIEQNFAIEQADILNYQVPKSDGIVANLFVNLLDKSYKNFYESLSDSKGYLILSGILIYDADYVVDIYTKNGFELIEKTTEFEWTALLLKAR